MDANWITAMELKDLADGSSRLVRHGDDRIAVFRVDGDVFAVDDRCPHEGYPLTQGSVCGTTLTCCFHNFKFDLRDGSCLMGDEAVRTYGTRVVQGRVQLDVTPPDPDVIRQRHWRSLEGAMRERKIGQVARDAVRLIHAGVEPAGLLRFAALWDARYGEYGTTHALPVAADLLRWLPRYPGVQAALPVVQGLEIAAEFHVRRAPRAVPDRVDPADFEARLAAAVEAEDVELAEGLMRGAIAAGFARDRIVSALLGLCAAHFLDFGHALIYAVKGIELLDATGWDAAEHIVGAQVHAIVTGTREDVLPAWKGWRRREAARRARYPEWSDGAAEAPTQLEALLLSGGSEAEEAVEAAFRDGASLRSVTSVLVVAAARRVLRFDESLEHDPAWRDSWLSVSHCQTFANAVRHAVEHASGPDAVRLVFQAVRFISMTAALDGEGEWSGDVAPLDHWMDRVISDSSTAAIHVAHGIKQVIAGYDDYRATGREECALAAIRFASAAKQERRVARRTREAIELVTRGAIPKSKLP